MSWSFNTNLESTSSTGQIDPDTLDNVGIDQYLSGYNAFKEIVFSLLISLELIYTIYRII